MSPHEQVSRQIPPAPIGSPLLDETLAELNSVRQSLWDLRIPDMVGAYFSDLIGILKRIQPKLSDSASAWLVVGDSQYADVQIATAKIIGQLSPGAGWHVRSIEPFRSMRLSPQQGGRPELAESLIILDK